MATSRWNYLATAVMAVVALTACDKKAVHDRPGDLGSLDLALVGSSTSGALYRLRSATIKIDGPLAVDLDTEQYLDDQRIQLALPVGDFSATFVTSALWYLEKKQEDETYVLVPAVLVSDNPALFTIRDQRTTNVVLRFRAGEDVIEMGMGRVRVSIAVDDVVNNGAEICPDLCTSLQPLLPCATDTITCEQACGQIYLSTPPQCQGELASYANCAVDQVPADFECRDTLSGAPTSRTCSVYYDALQSCKGVDPDPGELTPCELACSGFAGCSEITTCASFCMGGVVSPPPCDVPVAAYQACVSELEAPVVYTCSQYGLAGPELCVSLLEPVFTCLQGPPPPPAEICGDNIDNDNDTQIDEGCVVVVAPDGWNCPAEFYAAADGCDCGCGIVDTDCGGPDPGECGSCDAPGSCAVDCSEIAPDDNSQCQ